MLKAKSFFSVLTLALLWLGPSLSLAYSTKDVQFEPQDPGVSSAGSATVTTDAISTLSGLGTEDPVDMTVLIIQWILSILGLIFVVLIVYAGVRWMVSGGNEEEITSSKGILKAAFIGLVIILVAYGVTSFVFKYLVNITGAN